MKFYSNNNFHVECFHNEKNVLNFVNSKNFTIDEVVQNLNKLNVCKFTYQGLCNFTIRL